MNVWRSTTGYSRKAGMPPGTMVYTGEEREEDVLISSFSYDSESFTEKHLDEAEAISFLEENAGARWLNIDGLHKPKIIEAIGKKIGVHPLVMEDVLNVGQRPKLEDLGDSLFIVLKMLYINSEGKVDSEQVSIILANNTVITFQERSGDVFDEIRKRIRTGKGQVRRKSADYLTYALMDAVVDNYFVVLEQLGDTMEGLEDDVISSPTPETLHAIHRLKREMIYLRKSVWPLREVIGGMLRGGSHLIKEDTMVYLRDVYDHTIQVVETIETMRDMISGMLDIYLSSISNRMNEVMKVLTIIATIFIPLTFVAGVYGMNFEIMPELTWSFGYYLTLGIMAAISLVMVVFFRKKSWL